MSGIPVLLLIQPQDVIMEERSIHREDERASVIGTSNILSGGEPWSFQRPRDTSLVREEAIAEAKRISQSKKRHKQLQGVPLINVNSQNQNMIAGLQGKRSKDERNQEATN